MIKESIASLIDRKDLSSNAAEAVMNEIMKGEAKESQIAGFLTALRMKGETADEIIGCARAMRANSVRIKPRKTDLVDTCGTGGDCRNTFNVSTAAALVVSGAGLSVAKHGNRAVSSRCGSADILEALGVNVQMAPDDVARCIDEVGIGFMFAPLFHPAMKYAGGVRRELGIRTIFNILGPLTNPSGARTHLLGVFSPDLTEVMAQALNLLGAERAFVVHGMEGLDEISISGETKVSELKHGAVRTYRIAPEDAGLPRHDMSGLNGGSVEANVGLMMDVLKGAKGAARDITLINAAACLVAGGRAETLKDGVKLAAGSIDKGTALAKLEALKNFSKHEVTK